ncbi:MAG TPA: histidine phosphatase family protein [Dermatophilaceae bacterium]|jgi:2,3-bisphosphoglycerate-dependent phosphoglycerate mutase
MSDLQCPATVLIAGHGEAEYAVAGVLSDEGGRLTETGRGQVHDLAEQVRSHRVAAVYSSRMQRAVESAKLAALALGLQPLVADGLQEFSVGDLAGLGFHDERAQRVFDAWLLGDLRAGCPGGEEGHGVVRRFTEAIGGIADRHRGETVLVFTHSGAMSLAIPRVSVNAGSDFSARRFLASCAVAEVQVDSDGWRLMSWPGTTDPALV